MHFVSKGKIIGFGGNWGSGLATLTLEDMDTGEIVSVYADSGPLGRALGECYDAIGAGNTIDNEKIAGEEVYFSLNDLGLLEAFSPVDTANPMLVQIYEEIKEHGTITTERIAEIVGFEEDEE